MVKIHRASDDLEKMQLCMLEMDWNIPFLLPLWRFLGGNSFAHGHDMNVLRSLQISILLKYVVGTENTDMFKSKATGMAYNKYIYVSTDTLFCIFPQVVCSASSLPL